MTVGCVAAYPETSWLEFISNPNPDEYNTIDFCHWLGTHEHLLICSAEMSLLEILPTPASIQMKQERSSLLEAYPFIKKEKEGHL